MRGVLLAIAVAALAAAGWLLRYDVAAEAQVRALVSAKGSSRRQLPTGRADDHLVSILDRETDPARRAAAAELLGKSTSYESTQALLRALGDPDPGVQAAARAIGAHSARVEMALGRLDKDSLVRLLQSCSATPTLYWVFDLAVRSRPDLAVETSQAVLPRVGPNQVTWAVSVLQRGVAPGLRRDPASREGDPSQRRRLLACLSTGLESPHETVRALFAQEIANWGGPEPSADLAAVLLAGLQDDSAFHHYFLDAGRRKSPHVEEWARKVVMGDQGTGVYWTLLAVDQTVGRDCAGRLAREGLGNPVESARMECQRWLDSYARERK